MATPKKKKIKKTESPGLASSEKLKSWWAERKDFILFLGGVLLLLGGYFWLSAWSFYLDYIFTPAVNFYAKAGSIILNIFGQGTTAAQELISNDAFRMSIAKGCDGIAPIILLIAGILMFPSKWNYKWKGILFGTLALILLNLLRIVSLFLFGVYAPGIFDIMHVEVWQAVFIVIAILLWLSWLIWANNKELKASQAATKNESDDTP